MYSADSIRIELVGGAVERVKRVRRVSNIVSANCDSPGMVSIAVVASGLGALLLVVWAAFLPEQVESNPPAPGENTACHFHLGLP